MRIVTSTSYNSDYRLAVYKASLPAGHLPAHSAKVARNTDFISKDRMASKLLRPDLPLPCN